MLEAKINAGIEPPKQAEECKTKASSWAVFRWPEFWAFARRLGVDLSRPYCRMVIDLNIGGDEMAKVYLEQMGADAAKVKGVIDTMTFHNEQHRTCSPNPRNAEQAGEPKQGREFI